MNTKAAKKAIKKIAAEEGITEDEVREEIQKAILAGYMNPVTRNMWNKVFGKNIIPTPEEFIVKIGKIVTK